ERDRHPALDAWLTWLAAGIALDPHQLGRAAADIEQDRATARGVEQRRAADHRKRRLGLAVDHFELDTGFGLNAIPEAIGVRGRAAGLGRDQAKAAGLPGLDLVAADRERSNGALDRRFADAAGGGDALAQPDDPGEGIDHAKAVAGGTGDQEPAIIGAEVERRVDLGRSFGRSICPLGLRGRPACRRGPCRARSLQVFARQAMAKPRVIIHANCLSAAVAGRLGMAFSPQTVAAPKGCATTSNIGTMSNRPLWLPVRCIISRRRRKTARNQAVSCKITLRPRPSKTLLQCKNTASASRSAAKRTTRWSAARASTPTISACRSRLMAGSPAPAMPTAS